MFHDIGQSQSAGADPSNENNRTFKGTESVITLTLTHLFITQFLRKLWRTFNQNRFIQKQSSSVSSYHKQH